MSALRPVLKATVVAWLAALAFFEWTTLLVAWVYLDWRRVPAGVLALWAIRAPLFVAATWGVRRDRAWALVLAALLLASTLALSAPPWGNMDYSQFLRRAGALCALAILGALWRGRARV
jgi:hypothetical protein